MAELFATPISALARTRPATISRFKSLGIHTYGDLLEYFPSRFEDYSLTSLVARLQEGELVTIQGTVESAKNLYLRRRLTIQKVVVRDASGTVTATWYNQPYVVTTLKEGSIVSLAGVVKQFQKKLSLEVKSYEVLTSLEQSPVHTGRLIPVYPQKRGLSSRILREKIAYVFTQGGSVIPEILPSAIIRTHHLLSRSEAFTHIHFPKDSADFEKAKERLAFEELFVLQLAAATVHLAWKKEHVGHILTLAPHKKKIDDFLKGLPFTLTGAQLRVTREIFEDLGKSTPMNRFLQGEVGSGKTVVAAAAAYVTALNGYQTLVMAPTEILANQHYETLTKLFTPLGVKVALLTGSSKKQVASSKGAVKKQHATNYSLRATSIIVGTHALLHTKKKYKNLGLVVVDEQHRFGVKQRNMLSAAGLNPHLLTMTATPIPRTLALAVYGQLEVSALDEMPRDRLPVKTYLVPPQKREAAYIWINKKIGEGQQVFIVCPFIEESPKETMKSVRAATAEYERLTTGVFSNARSALIHGKLPSAQKKEIMSKFKEHALDILVSTPVVEVGIDIPNATIMLIEGAERYGLAQLHQLRGRVGRGALQSYCLVFTSDETAGGAARLSFFARTQSGMELAEYDLKHRGAGQMYGTMQHGQSFLKLANLTDTALVKAVQQEIASFLKKDSIGKYPELKRRVNGMELDFIGPN